jgi:hypothetical protein
MINPNTPTDDFDWASLEDHVTPDGTFTPPARRPSSGKDAKVVRFPCPQCQGTGKWRGGHTNQHGSSHCFACKGQGYFMTSERDRANARQSAAQRKTRKLADDRKVFDEANPGISEFLVSATWSDFCQDLLAKLNQYGSLSERQVGAVRSTMERSQARRDSWNAEREAAKQAVDLGPIRAMFETAVASGHKRPTYRAAGLVINRAPDHGRNPGALYVKTEEGDEYLGKIIGTQYSGKSVPALAAIAADPRGEAVAWGRKYGRCSCCGRELSDPQSVALGIGPICATKWGL